MRYLQMLGIALLIASFMMALSAASIVRAEPGSVPASDAAAGEKTWASKACKSCHGDKAEGKYALPLAGTARTLQEVMTQVRTPRAQMPAFKTDKVTDQEITDIYAYLQTLTKPASFTPLRYEAKAGDDPGKVMFNQKRCAACHGENAERLAAIVLGTGRKTITQDEILKQVRTPRNNMPTFRTDFVTDADVATMASFIKTAVETAAAAAPAAQGTVTATVTVSATVAATRPATATVAAATPVPTEARDYPATAPTATKAVTTTTPATLPATGGEGPQAALIILVGFVGLSLLAAGQLLRRAPRS